MAYSFSSVVRYSECDTSSRLTIPALINYLQDCSTFHTESVGHGVRFLAEHGFAWFIAAWQIQIERLPQFMEHIEVSTWSYAMKATMANRNFLVRSADGEVLVRADSLWFPFDTRLGRAIRVPEGEDVYLTDDAPLDLPPTQRKIRLQGTGVERGRIVVAEHHLDTNHHVNNGQYVAMADEVVRAFDEDFDVRRICVQYKNAARLGDVIVPRLHVEEGGLAVDLADEQGKSYAIVRLTAWEGAR